VYTTAKQTFAQSTVAADQLEQERVSVDSSASRLAVRSTAGIQVYDSSYNLLGTVSGIIVRLAVVNPQGTRLYAFTDDHMLYTYDITAAVTGGGFLRVGPALPQMLPSQSQFPVVLSSVSPDGGTLFLVSDGGIAVIPSPS
jgi:hypothetical protein